MNRTIQTFLRTASFIFLSVFAIACNNDDDDDTGVAQVVVVNMNGNRVPQAIVELECESSIDRPCDIFVTGYTDGVGVYETEWTYNKVLKVNAFKVVRDTQIVGVIPDTTHVITADSTCGESYISIRSGETTRQTVVLYECN
tara:strand:- start:255 stop:680 length:426 start_codon:yes stop_codon:yes gene_type:complete